MNRKALGRGLGALLSSDRTIDLGTEPSEVDLNTIVPGPMQPRTNFDEAALESLADHRQSDMKDAMDELLDRLRSTERRG